MFDENAIKHEDFSCDLPMIISKIALVSEVIRLYPLFPEVNHELEDIHLQGVCSVLLEIESDLWEINKALYGTDEPEGKQIEATNTAEQAAEGIGAE